MKSVGLQGPAHGRLCAQLQELLFVVQHGPVGQTLAIRVPVDMPSRQGRG